MEKVNVHDVEKWIGAVPIHFLSYIFARMEANFL